MIMNNQKEKYAQVAKQEGEDNNPVEKKQISRLSTPFTTSSTRQFGGFKNPRIVRVSRAFGGKDRHSKVCTIRGLRDRRIRLSVPTAIQLYDLQDRLGLNQPSKVVDWLLDVTKNEIDQLPPLQMPQGGLFPQDYCSSTMLANHSQVFGAHYLESGDISTSSLSKAHHQENLEKYEGYVSHHHHQLSAQDFFPLANQTSTLQGSLDNNNTNYLRWEPPNLTLSQFGNHSLDSQIINNSNSTSVNSSTALHPSSSSHHQLYFCPSSPTVPSILPSTYPPPFMNLSSSSSMENNEQSRQMMMSNFQRSFSSSQHEPNSLTPTTLHLVNSSTKPFGFNVSPFKINPAQENDDHQQNKKG